ncbi:MAG: GNAT family N-acetyltransferase [Caulobacteraceae bacterium]
MTALQPSVRIHRRIAEIGREAWDACASAPDFHDNPFISYDFLDICEQSGCAVERQGWGPHHLSIEDDAGRIGAVLPFYAKSHSQGEYVFDHSWADAYERAGGQYYPKLIAAAPFSPVPGPRLLVRPDIDRNEGRRMLIGAAMTFAKDAGISTIGFNFPMADEWKFMGEEGLLQRQNQQYHWLNQGYATFDDFLGALSSGRRKTIRRERRDAQAELEIHCLTGNEITEAHWDAFFEFYMDTASRKWGSPYLNRRFFSMLGERMADRVLLVLARRKGRWIAGAYNMIGGDCLYGRNWGCIEHVPFLHFELCYYQAIEWAIGRGLARVEAGAQGQHKIARGYLPTAVYSTHYIADPGLRRAVARFLEEERAAVQGEMDWLAEEYSPFRLS